MHQFLRAIGFSDITKKQLNEVINNIIDTTKIENGKYKINLEE